MGSLARILPFHIRGQHYEAAHGCYCTATAFIAVFAAAVFSFLAWKPFFKRSASNLSYAFPKGPPSWPILGHVPLLHAGCPHQTLASLSLHHGYGPIIGLRLGTVPAVVVSSVSLAKEVLLTQDKAFANRPRYACADTLFYGYDVGVLWSSYSPHWIRLRKIYTVELLTAKRIHDLQYVREQEMAGLLDKILIVASNGAMAEAIDVGKWMGEMSTNLMSRLLQSKTLSEASYMAMGGCSLSDLAKQLEHEQVPTIGDHFPWLKCLDVLRKCRMRRIHNKFDKILNIIMMERRQAMRSTMRDELPHDFLQVLLSKEVLDNDGLQEEFLTTKEIKALLLDLLGAGIHTSPLTLEWAMAELLQNPSCFQKLRKEIDTVLGHKGEQQVTDEDIFKLPYLQNTVKEVLRLHPVAPLLGPRIILKACQVDEFTLPMGTQVFVNVWAIGRDPRIWQEPERFWPERFEGMDIDLRGQHYELLPFGSGRRICPGLRLGLSVVQVTLANLAKFFDWELPIGQTPVSVDMSEKRGAASKKATPVLAIPKLRQVP